MALFGRSARVRPVQQMEAAECGVACLAMVLDHHGCSKPLSLLREQCGTSRDGNSALELLKCARSYGLEARGVRLEPAALGSLALPAILHWELNHFVVLERWHGGDATLVDPASGRVRVDAETLDRCFSGIALELTPTPRLVRERRVRPGLGHYLRELSARRRLVLFVLAAGACAQLFGVVSPAVNQLLIDEVIQPARKELLLPLVAVLFGAAVAETWVRWLHGTVMAKLAGTLAAGLGQRLGRHLLSLPLPFVESRSRGDLLDRVQAQGEVGTFLGRAVLGVFDLFFVVALASLMLAYDATLAALTLGIDLLRLGVVRVLREECRQRAAGEIAARGREQAVVLDVAASAELVKAFGIEAALRGWYRRRLTERAEWSVRTRRLSDAASRALSIFDAAAAALVLWWGGQRVLGGAMSLGVFAGFLAIRALMSAPLGSLLGTLEGWLGFQSTLSRADDLLSEPRVSEGTRKVARLSGRIELENVGFRYGSGGAWVFRNVSLRVEPGEQVALVGPSGQGKSTLLRIMCGLLAPSEGRVLIDGVDVREYAPETLAKSVGALLGLPLVLEGSVKENIALRLPSASDQACERAARESAFHEVVLRMPHGYAARLEAGGQNLSGGERQRLGIAQALLGAPPLLFLDEATCFLDPETEERVLDAIVARKATIVSVAHRPRVIERAGRVLEVQDGHVVERQRAVPSPPARRLSLVHGYARSS